MDIVDNLEAILFVADVPAPLQSLTTTLGATEGQVEQALEVLGARLDQRGPLQLVQIAGGYQLSTKSEYSDVIANFLKPQKQRLTRSLMEVLAIVAYKQPITQAELDQVRGVQSDYGIRSLLDKRLVQEVGRKQTAGRPFMYGTTQQFLHQFNINDLNQLPPLSFAVPLLEVQQGGLAS